MALDHPADPTRRREGPHPALSLLIGFGVIIVGAMIVHVVFNGLV